MSKESYRNRIADKRNEIITLREKLSRKRDEKKRAMSNLACNIKNATGTTKENYRRSKVTTATRYDNEIEHLQDLIERANGDLSNLKEQLAHER